MFKNITNKVSDYNRARKYKFFINYFSPGINTKILDVGPSEIEHLKYANILEKKYPYPENITVLGVDNFKEFPIRYPKVKIKTYKGGRFPFNDNMFNICWSNAVIEHIGDTTKQREFLKEISRVAKTSFITTPNRYFPFETHTRIFLLHFLPKKIFNNLMIKMGKRRFLKNPLNLLSLGDIKRLLEECNITKYKIIKQKLLWFTVSFAIII